MKKVLIITYYWPPSGGSGVQRWLKMAKYLPEFGWEPIIYTPENPELMARDEALLKDVLPDLKVWKHPIFEPYSVYKIFTGKRGKQLQPGFVSDTARNGWKERLALFIRSNFFVPDPRCFWRGPSVRYVRKKLQQEPVDWIITTGPPQSIHLIGRDLHRKTGIPWLADFRDPWTKIYYFKHLKMMSVNVQRQKKMEASVIKEANVVTVVSPQMKRDFLPLGPKRIEVIPNGYDEADFFVEPITVKERFTICHTGLFTRDANPDQLWKALAAIALEDAGFKQDLRMVLVGQVDGAVKDSIAQEGLLGCTEFVPYVPHLQAVAYQKGADVLLLSLKKEPESKGIITGKFFEYLASGNPILGIGPVEGDLAQILKECGAGAMHEFDDFEGAKAIIETWYADFKSQKGWRASNASQIQSYTRRNLCEKLTKLL